MREALQAYLKELQEREASYSRMDTNMSPPYKRHMYGRQHEIANIIEDLKDLLDKTAAGC